jgi:hypothetical protein
MAHTQLVERLTSDLEGWNIWRLGHIIERALARAAGKEAEYREELIDVNGVVLAAEKLRNAN